MRNLNRIVIHGAGAAGLTTAESLRRLGFGGTIRMVHAEHTLPYDRPPLSKQVWLAPGPPRRCCCVHQPSWKNSPSIGHHRVQASRQEHPGLAAALRADALLLERSI
jgi:2-polyprenyl-6-methoxyphenol hydroxylase-like FAD-dependent oxidoreductase